MRLSDRLTLSSSNLFKRRSNLVVVRILSHDENDGHTIEGKEEEKISQRSLEVPPDELQQLIQISEGIELTIHQ